MAETYWLWITTWKAWKKLSRIWKLRCSPWNVRTRKWRLFLKSKCTELHSDVSELKTELTKCADVIRHHASKATDNDRAMLSEGLNAISRKTCKLESARNNIASNIANVERSVQDNTVNITNIAKIQHDRHRLCRLHGDNHTTRTWYSTNLIFRILLLKLPEMPLAIILHFTQRHQ